MIDNVIISKNNDTTQNAFGAVRKEVKVPITFYDFSFIECSAGDITW